MALLNCLVVFCTARWALVSYWRLALYNNTSVSLLLFIIIINFKVKLTDWPYWPAAGYNRRGVSGALTEGRWSDGGSTEASVGVWGHREPDVSAGDCTYIKRASGVAWTWHMANCDLDLPFVCQATPCPDSECSVNRYMWYICDPTSRNESHGCFLWFYDYSIAHSIDFSLKWCENYHNRSTGIGIMTL